MTTPPPLSSPMLLPALSGFCLKLHTQAPEPPSRWLGRPPCRPAPARHHGGPAGSAEKHSLPPAAGGSRRLARVLVEWRETTCQPSSGLNNIRMCRLRSALSAASAIAPRRCIAQKRLPTTDTSMRSLMNRVAGLRASMSPVLATSTCGASRQL